MITPPRFANTAVHCLLMALGLGCLAPGRAQCTTSVEMESRDEIYFYDSDLLSAVQLNPILLTVSPFLQPAVGLVESLQTGCATVNIFGFQVSGDPDHAFSFDFSTTLSGVAGVAGEFGQNGISFNGAKQVLFPTISPCNRVPYQTITHLGGSGSLYVVHAGNGPYKKKITRAMFHTCRDVVVENPGAGPVELPVKVQGGVFAAGSFALDDFTFGHARLHAWGQIGGSGFDETTDVRAADVVPVDGGIDVVRRFVIAPGSTRAVVHIEVSAEALVEVQAKGGGLFGLITASATAGVDFPNSIEIGRPTGPNGGPLPAGVRVQDERDPGTYYAMTAPVIEARPGTTTTLPLRIYTPVGGNYRLETSGALRSWTPLLTTNVNGGRFDFTVTNAPGAGAHFYRVARP